MSKTGIWEIKNTNFKNKTYILQSNNLSNSLKNWYFTLLIMHYFVYGSLCFSLSAQTYFADSQLCGLSAALSRLRSLTFCLQFWHKALGWAGFFSRASALAN